MRKNSIILLLIISNTLFSQDNLVNLSKINFCPLSLEDLKKMDTEIKLVAIEQKDFCVDSYTEDGSPEIKFGYKSKLFPGVLFYEPKNAQNLIEKIHLTKEFKGYLPDGKFMEIRALTVANALKMYDSKFIFTPSKCMNYFEMMKDDGQDIILKVYKTNTPLNKDYHSNEEQLATQAIDILFECYFDSIEEKNKPLYIVDGKEIKEKEFLTINPDNIKSLNILKEKNAELKYGKKGKNGVVEVILIK